MSNKSTDKIDEHKDRHKDETRYLLMNFHNWKPPSVKQYHRITHVFFCLHVLIPLMMILLSQLKTLKQPLSFCRQKKHRGLVTFELKACNQLSSSLHLILFSLFGLLMIVVYTNKLKNNIGCTNL